MHNAHFPEIYQDFVKFTRFLWSNKFWLIQYTVNLSHYRTYFCNIIGKNIAATRGPAIPNDKTVTVIKVAADRVPFI